MIGVVEDQLAVGIVGPHRLEQRLGLEFCKGFGRFVPASGQFQSFRQVIQVLGVRCGRIALLEKLQSDHAAQRCVLLLTGWTPDELLENAQYAQRAEHIARLQARISVAVSA